MRVLFIILFLTLFQTTNVVLAQCLSTEVPFVVSIIPDTYPQETSWKLFANNIEIANGFANSDTICVDTSACFRFDIYDSYGDGICCGYGQGSYTISLNGIQVGYGGQFAFSATHSFNCPQGSICENPYTASIGLNNANQPNTFFEFIPDSTGIYSISTCGSSTCDTRLWVYDDCSDVIMNGTATGPIYFDDNGCGLQSEISALFMQGQLYFIRVGINDSTTCLSTIPFTITYQSSMSSVLPLVQLTTIGAPINNDFKVPVLMQIIDNGPGQLNYLSDTNYSYDGNILTEWQGFSGPGYPKKNYDFDLIDAAGNKIDTSLLGLPAENDWIFKAEYLDNTLLINSVSYEFARRMGRYAPRTRQCEIFLDGNYIGVYTLTEKIKRDQNRVDIAKLTIADTTGSDLTGGYIIEMNWNGDPGSWNSSYLPINSATCSFPVEFKNVYPKADVILPIQREYIKTYVDSFENALNASSFQDPQWGYRNWIDVSTFIDFLIVNEFSMNYDSYGRSTYMYKEKDTDGGKLCIGPAWDYDRAMASNPTSGWVWENTHPYWPFPFWWSKMYTDSIYNHELACRWLSLRQDVFQTTKFVDFVDSLANILLQGPSARNFAIWQTLNNTTYQDQVTNMKNFLIDRLVWMDNTLAPFGAVLPTITIPQDTLVCKNTLYSAPFNSAYSYNWTPGPELPSILLDSEQLLMLELRDAFGCYVDLTMQVNLSIPDSTFQTQQISTSAAYIFTAMNGSNSTYTWNFGDNTPVETGEQVTHIFAQNGLYQVTFEVIDSIGCSSSYSIDLLINTVGIEEISASSFLVYPNPSRDVFNISFTSETVQNLKVRVLNVVGEELIADDLQQFVGEYTKQINLQDNAKGIYFLEIETDNGIINKKLILQ